MTMPYFDFSQDAEIKWRCLQVLPDGQYMSGRELPSSISRAEHSGVLTELDKNMDGEGQI